MPFLKGDPINAVLSLSLYLIILRIPLLNWTAVGNIFTSIHYFYSLLDDVIIIDILLDHLILLYESNPAEINLSRNGNKT